MRIKQILVCFIVFCSLQTFAQNQKFSTSGYVTDAETGEALIAANVYDIKSSSGTTTNTYGFYSITLPTDSAYLLVSYIGYQTQKLPVKLGQNASLNIKLLPAAFLNTIEISASKNEEAIEQKSQMSTVKISPREIDQLPAFLGEADVLKALQLMPGVQSGSEGQSGLYVRGGSPDQNLILLDGVPVYNASHLFGFFSVFNTDAINDIKLIKGGFPARYGGRLSSVLDISMKEGNNQKLKGTGSIGLMASKLTLEGPLFNDKTSFIISGRRTYIDLLAQPFIQSNFKNSGNKGKVGYFFHDVNAKINHKISNKDRLYLSLYTGTDKFYYDVKEKFTTGDYTQKIGLGWGNLTSAFRYNRIWGNRLFSNLTLTYSKYNFNTTGGTEDNFIEKEENYTNEFNLSYDSGIEDYAAKIDFDFIPNPKHTIRFGTNYIRHNFKPGAFNVFTKTEDFEVDTLFGQNKVQANEFAAYIEDDFEINRNLKINAGIHFSAFSKQKGYYTSIQPRLGLRYLLPDGASIKASFATMQQYIQFLTNENLGLPTDLWLPTTDVVKPQSSFQVAMGYAKTFNNNYELSVEAYYKEIKNVLSYKEGASFIDFGDWQDNVTQGKGNAYGAEFLLRKKKGDFTGWLGYTLAWSNRQFDDINFGKTYPFKYDRRHDISLVGVYKLSDRISLSASWVLGSGNAYTLAEGYYAGTFLSGTSESGVYYSFLAPFYKNRNNQRSPSYHRLDSSISFFKQKKRYDRTWSFGFYNMYNRANPFLLTVATDTGDSGLANKTVLKKISLFPVVPYFNWGFSF